MMNLQLQVRQLRISIINPRFQILVLTFIPKTTQHLIMLLPQLGMFLDTHIMHSFQLFVLSLQKEYGIFCVHDVSSQNHRFSNQFVFIFKMLLNDFFSFLDHVFLEESRKLFD